MKDGVREILQNDLDFLVQKRKKLIENNDNKKAIEYSKVIKDTIQIMDSYNNLNDKIEDCVDFDYKDIIRNHQNKMKKPFNLSNLDLITGNGVIVNQEKLNDFMLQVISGTKIPILDESIVCRGIGKTYVLSKIYNYLKNERFNIKVIQRSLYNNSQFDKKDIISLKNLDTEVKGNSSIDFVLILDNNFSTEDIREIYNKVGNKLLFGYYNSNKSEYIIDEFGFLVKNK